MSDLLDQAHARAWLDPLEDNAALVVFDGKVPDPTPGPPYVLVYVVVEWPPGEDGFANGFDHQSVTCRTTAYCHCVGSSAAACRALTAQVRATLLNIRPTVAGRVCSLVEQIDSVPPQRDEQTGPLVMDSTVVYAFTSAPG